MEFPSLKQTKLLITVAFGFFAVFAAPQPASGQTADADLVERFYAALADAFQAMGTVDNEAAASHLRQAATLIPTRPEPPVFLGILSTLKDDFDVATEYYREALANFEKEPVGLDPSAIGEYQGLHVDLLARIVDLADGMWFDGDLVGAAELLSESIVLEPTHRESLELFALILEEDGNLEGLLSIASSLVVYEPLNAEYWNLLISAHEGLDPALRDELWVEVGERIEAQVGEFPMFVSEIESQEEGPGLMTIRGQVSSANAAPGTARTLSFHLHSFGGVVGSGSVRVVAPEPDRTSSFELTIPFSAESVPHSWSYVVEP